MNYIDKKIRTIKKDIDKTFGIIKMVIENKNEKCETKIEQVKKLLSLIEYYQGLINGINYAKEIFGKDKK